MKKMIFIIISTIVCFTAVKVEAKQYVVLCTNISGVNCSKFENTNLTYNHITTSNNFPYWQSSQFSYNSNTTYSFYLNSMFNSIDYTKAYDIFFNFKAPLALELVDIKYGLSPCTATKIDNDLMNTYSVSCPNVIRYSSTMNLFQLRMNFRSTNGTGTGHLMFLSYFDLVESNTDYFNALTNQNQQILNSIQSGNKVITDNQNKNSQDQIDNANKNHDEQIANENKNHEEAEKTRKGILGTLGSVFDSIVELPGKLVNLLLDGLKSLFIPSEDQIRDILDRSGDLASNFGFIGQTVDFFISLISDILLTSQGVACVDLPELKIQFSAMGIGLDDWIPWNQQNVCLNEHPWLGRTDVITTIRTIITISLLILFLRMANREFDYILSKENSKPQQVESGDSK